MTLMIFIKNAYAVLTFLVILFSTHLYKKYNQTDCIFHHGNKNIFQISANKRMRSQSQGSPGPWPPPRGPRGGGKRSRPPVPTPHSTPTLWRPKKILLSKNSNCNLIECKVEVYFDGKNVEKNKFPVHRLTCTLYELRKKSFILISEMHFSANFVLYTGSLKQWLYTPEQGEITLLQCLPLHRVGS